MIRFRHYKLDAYSERNYGFCWTPSGEQPTLDIYFGKHVFVWFRSYR